MKRKIIRSYINQGSLEEQTPHLLALAKSHTPSYVCLTNVHMLIEGYDDTGFQHVVNSATMAFPDGTPVAKMFKLLYGVSQERIAGMDLFPYLLQRCNEESLKVAFVGATPEVLKALQKKVREQFKNIEITFAVSPPFNATWDNEVYVERINSSNTHMVFVALGCPKQERWMFEHSKKINATLYGVGGAFPVFVGEIKRAPLWMQKSGLEWFYRLIMEPKRMFRRYLYTNTKFFYLALRQILNK
ncbi:MULTISPECIES: WecB/TagA/CpsF family glycosyltransferase [Altibacter]|uniref:WecB/TagA/CpsF family glycosyltransferase n=1 Tax=Altibacter TaxID=1535231 RepID=UPI000558F3C0|nr:MULTISPECIES: WecB/TagA/CpsF family glycosyltransferase [Altibacter]MCW9037375.1 WecB/TagA/CpsF family glycosyltransferase [Altibacter sp.]